MKTVRLKYCGQDLSLPYETQWSVNINGIWTKRLGQYRAVAIHYPYPEDQPVPANNPNRKPIKYCYRIYFDSQRVNLLKVDNSPKSIEHAKQLAEKYLLDIVLEQKFIKW